MKAIALDMDGTMLTTKGEFKKDLALTLNKIQQRGYKIFLATGRTLHEITSVTPNSFKPDGVVAASGMGVYIHGKQIQAAQFDPNFVQDVLREARTKEIAYEIHTLEHSKRALLEDRPYIVKEVSQEKPHSMHDFEYDLSREALSFDDMWVSSHTFEHVVKLFFYSYSVEKIRNWYAYLDRLPNRESYSLYSTSTHNAELMLGGIDKSTGLKPLLDAYNLTFDSLHAIGDSMNDLPMFKMSGKSTAMQNANDEIKKEADEVTQLTCDEDGLNHYLIEQYL